MRALLAATLIVSSVLAQQPAIEPQDAVPSERVSKVPA